MTYIVQHIHDDVPDEGFDTEAEAQARVDEWTRTSTTVKVVLFRIDEEAS